MFTQQNRDELETRGVTVVPGVVPEADCDRHVQAFRRWVSNFPLNQWPQTRNSLIQRYKSGHLAPAWETRIAAKPVFAQVWGTEKLLSSFDAIAIGRPPEGGQEKFWEDGDSWLHVDQTADRVGLHAYQGAVYLEQCDQDDWTFEVVEGSHRVFDDFMTRTNQWRCRNLKHHDLKWLEGQGCIRKRVPCPKGGMILWDSRLFHANARPLAGRTHPGRWRYVVFVCMAPASWATPADLDVKRKAYDKMKLTTHWPSQECYTFSSRLYRNQAPDPVFMDVLPEVARSKEAKQLAGVEPYECEDDVDDCDVSEEGNDDDKGACASGGRRKREPSFRPAWDKEKWRAQIDEFKTGELGVKEKYGGSRKAKYKAR